MDTKIWHCELCTQTADYDFGDYGFDAINEHGVYACFDCQCQYDLEMYPEDVQETLRVAQAYD